MRKILALILLSFGVTAVAQAFPAGNETPFTVQYETRNDSVFRITTNQYSVKEIPNGKVYQTSTRKIFLFKVKSGTIISPLEVEQIDDLGSTTRHLKSSIGRYGKWPAFLRRQLLWTEEVLIVKGEALETHQRTLLAGIDTKFLGAEIFGSLFLLGIFYSLAFLIMKGRAWMSKLIAGFVITGLLLIIPQDTLFDMIFFDICLVAILTIASIITGMLAQQTMEHFGEQIIPPETSPEPE